MSNNPMKPQDMGHGVWLIDLMEQNQPCRTAAYLILDEQVTLIETGSSKSHDVLLEGMAELGVKPSDLANVIVTHVHLDHAGGAGHLMEKAKHAKLVVHPRGQRHMVDPSKLWAGATQVYGDRVTDLFGSIIPVPESQVLVRDHLETLDIGSRTLTFYDSPGHAKHHFAILDPVSNALFAGDAVGIRYVKGFTGWDFEWVMPSTSPVDFDPHAVRSTVEQFRNVPFEWIYHAHFGRSPKAEACAETIRGAEGLAAFIQQAYRPGISVEDVVSQLREWIRKDLQSRGFNPSENLDVLNIDVILDAMGLIHYQKRLQGR